MGFYLPLLLVVLMPLQ
ncbi:hypothetical protein LINGRAPRIM_LOCUS3206 [Linum grandiflorum]